MTYLDDKAGQNPILVSACLLGEPCRYDGASKECTAALELARQRAVIPVCPEQLGELPTPRTPSEIDAQGRVRTQQGEDRTVAFELGAARALEIARDRGCTLAVLKANSPSCGHGQIYDGTFSGTLIAGSGVAAQALESAGLTVIDEVQLATHMGESL